MKTGKNDGNVGHCSDHIIHGTSLLNEYISLLFTAMLVHGYSPEGFVLCTITSIPKNKRKSINDSDNYRGIALSSILSKIFDWIILTTHSNVFETSDLQFGFKQNHSTTQCTFVLKETINYYIKNGGQVFLTLLDASKAFDRVNYIKLFRLLIKKGLCPLMARFLLCMYTNQLIRVRWNDYTTQTFSVSNGVKQGGVLSPILFNIYIDELLTRLKQCGVGCYIGHVYVGSLAYVDDVSLLASSRNALCKMLDVCQSFSAEYDVLFNSEKSKLVIFDGDVKSEFKEILFCQTHLKNNQSDIHLGTRVGNDASSDNMKKSINDFYIRFNIMYSMFNHASNQVLYHLFKTYCMPLYGCQLWNYASNEINDMCVAWRKTIRYMLRIPQRTHNILLNFICDDFPLETQLHKRFIKFAYNIVHSPNICVHVCGKLALFGSMSDLCDSINYVFNRYEINKYMIYSQKTLSVNV